MSVAQVDHRPTRLLPWFYALLLLAGMGALWLINVLGSRLEGTTAAVSISVVETAAVTSNVAPSATSRKVDVAVHVLLTLAAIIGLGRLISWGLARTGQPAVMGEVLAGLALGPSLLGAISPDAMHWFIPDTTSDPQGLVISSLTMIAQLGVILYMFLVGLELNLETLGRHVGAAIAISHASILLPFVSGAALALGLYSTLAPADVSFSSFAMFLGVAMSITAFPVLARILTDRKMEHSELGVIALSCAATDDVTAWCLLAFVVGLAQAQVGLAWMVAVGAAVYVAFILYVAGPLLRSVVRRLEQQPGRESALLAMILLLVILSAVTTSMIGIHEVFGAFVIGVILPRDSRVARLLRDRIEFLTTVLMLPAFFAVTGMNTKLVLIDSWTGWLTCGLIIAVATLGKFGGTVLASRCAGLDWKTSSSLGVLMNTRGLMELIVLNIGLSLGVISEELFAMMVMMAIVTTLAAAPLLNLLQPKIEPAPL